MLDARQEMKSYSFRGQKVLDTILTRTSLSFTEAELMGFVVKWDTVLLHVSMLT